MSQNHITVIAVSTLTHAPLTEGLRLMLKLQKNILARSSEQAPKYKQEDVTIIKLQISNVAISTHYLNWNLGKSTLHTSLSSCKQVKSFKTPFQLKQN